MRLDLGWLFSLAVAAFTVYVLARAARAGWRP